MITFNHSLICFNKKQLTVEIADTAKKRALGLMNRKQLDENKGMLFVFDKEYNGGFWMYNTYLPLSIGFFDKHNRLIDIKPLTPKSIKSVYAKQGYYSALEVNRGWFKRHNIKLNTQYKKASSGC